MRSKLLTLVICYVLVNIAFSCCDSVKYTDYNGIEFIPKKTQISSTDSLAFEINRTDEDLMSHNTTHFGLITGAYAFDCDEGWGGEKYAISEFKVISDTDFDEAHPAGSSLNDLINLDATTDQEIRAYKNLNDADLNIYRNWWNTMYIKQRPTASKTHHLTVSFLKSNGASMAATSEAITWE